MKKIITISREFGAGGGEICRKVAERLNWDYYDKAIILNAAKESGIDVESILKMEEKMPLNFGFGQSLFNFYSKPMDEKLYEAERQIIRGYAEKGNCIILGRNANSILKEFDNTLHIFVTAPKEYRLERMKPKMPDETDEQLMDRINNIDKNRKKYCNYYTGKEFGNAGMYDLCINTAKIDIDRSVDLIVNLVND